MVGPVTSQLHSFRICCVNSQIPIGRKPRTQVEILRQEIKTIDQGIIGSTRSPRRSTIISSAVIGVATEPCARGNPYNSWPPRTLPSASTCNGIQHLMLSAGTEEPTEPCTSSGTYVVHDADDLARQ